MGRMSVMSMLAAFCNMRGSELPYFKSRAKIRPIHGL